MNVHVFLSDTFILFIEKLRHRKIICGMIAEPFELLQLPRLNQKTGNAISTSTDAEFVFVGVSGSSISTLGLRPPQVVRTHSLAPTASVTSLLAVDARVLAYASVERGKNMLHLLPVNEGVKSQSVELNSPALGLYISSDKSVIGVLQSTQLVVYSAENLREVWRSSKTEELVFSSNMNGSDETTIVAVNKAGTKLTASVLALDARGIHTLVKQSINIAYSHKALFSFYESRLFVAVDSDIHAFSVPQMHHLGYITSRHGENDVKGLIALPNNSIVVVRGNEVQLLDFGLQSLISSIKVPSGINALLDYVPKSSTLVALQGQSLVGFSVTPTQGTLLESIGRGYSLNAELPLTDIFDGFKHPAQQYREVAQTQLAASMEESQQVVKDLEHFISSRDGFSFAAIVSYLKSDKKWSEIVADDTPITDDLVYDETDRNADRYIVERACELAFLPRFKPYLPIGVAVYLLTHPLFPLEKPQFAKLMPRLEKSDGTLYRQALVSLTGLSVPDLVRGLLNADEATFLDAASRLQEDYSGAQILSGIRKAFKTSRSISTLGVLVERLSQYSQTIGLMAPFIDAMGLLAWNVDHIQQLHAHLNAQIESLEATVKAGTAISDLFNTIGLSPSESSLVSAGEAKQRAQSHNEKEHRVVPKYSIETLTL